MKQLPVSLLDLTVCLEDRRRKCFDYYLDTQTGEIIELNRQLFQELENCEDIVPDDPVFWQPKEVEEMIQVVNDTEGRYKLIPQLKSNEQLEIMHSFIQTISDEAFSQELEAALRDRHAFARFHQVLKQNQKYLPAFDRFEEDAHQKLLESWLAKIDIDPQWH